MLLVDGIVFAAIVVAYKVPCRAIVAITRYTIGGVHLG